MNPSAQDNEEFIHAVRSNDVEMVKLLLADSRVDPSAQDYRAIKNAFRSRRFEIVKLLLADSRVGPTTRKEVEILTTGCYNYELIENFCERNKRFRQLHLYDTYQLLLSLTCNDVCKYVLWPYVTPDKVIDVTVANNFRKEYNVFLQNM